MKQLLTIIVGCDTAEKHASTLYDGIELIYPEENESEKDLILRATKLSKGKYTILINETFRLADISSLLNMLDKNSPDMLVFAGGTAIKSSIVKAVAKDCQDVFSCFILSVLDSKSVLKSTYIPFIFDKNKVNFSEANYAGLLTSAERFVALKAKLSKDVYSHALSALCARLIIFYASAMLDIRDGKMDSEVLASFDGKLKAEIVLYLAFEKNFTAANLTKLRKKGFKISWLTAKKFKKMLNFQ